MKQEEETGFLLINVKNVFNEGNHTNMILTVQYIWVIGARFAFNCYRHHAMLYLKLADGQEVEMIHSREEVNQENILMMIAYGILLLSMICILKNYSITIITVVRG